MRTGGPRGAIRIVNVVSTADLAQKIDIASFNSYDSLSSDLRLYRCGYVKDSGMDGRVTVFGSGKMISVGTRSAAGSFGELRRAARILRGHGLASRRRLAPSVRNIVASVRLGDGLDIEALSQALPRSLYEPEQFPGVIHRTTRGAVALLFASGRAVLVGAASEGALREAHAEVSGMVERALAQKN
ncbi:MAG: hypothetical protein OXU37_00120 [Thaumarchaeota archaeon]|nr:hypothetical protein [Nitrososphaerota archaeon]MDD9812673.1 hypothetical protein [Nitrososphaerota archaeon]MDD9843597.1 hypothetical protein [Nitrososphaerota archaeon]